MRVLLVDTNFSAAPIHEALSKAGHDVFVCGANANDYLARVASNYLPFDYSQVETLREQVIARCFDAVIPGCNDVSYTVCSLLRELAPQVRVDPPATWRLLNDKDLFRKFAMQTGLPVPRAFDQENVPLNHPVIVKPSESFSGKGITVLIEPTPDSLERATALARQTSRNGRAVTEQYVEGQLYSHSAFLKDRRVDVDFFVEEHSTAHPFTVDTSWVTQDLSGAVQSQIRGSIEKLAETLQLGDGLIHTQFICGADSIYLIEITRRCPGDRYADLISLSTDFAYAERYAYALLGLAPRPRAAPAKSRQVVRHTITSSESFVFRGFGVSPQSPVLQFLPLAVAGDVVRESPHGRAGLVFFEAKGKAAFHTLKKLGVSRQLIHLH